MDPLGPLLQCRACSTLCAEHELVALFGGIGSQLASIFSLCTGLACVEDDGLPINLCAGCNAKLTGFHQFRQRCAHWDAEFRAHQREKQPVLKEEVKNEHTFAEHEAEEDDAQNMFDSGLHLEVLPDQYDIMDSQEMLPVKTETVPNQSSDSSHPQTDLLAAVVYRCDICQARFFKKPRLEKHMHDQHSMPKQRTACGVRGCPKTYTSDYQMRLHRKNIHQIEAEPSESATAKSVPIDPKDEFEMRRFVCDQCGKRFKNSSALKDHSYTHTGQSQMPHACTLCPRRYVSKHKLREHIKRHEGVRDYVCPHCGMRKTTAHELKVHINYHTREKMWPCPSCPKIFTNVGNMSRHVRIVHNGVREHVCTYCEQSFGKAETLKHHVMRHTGERPHGCDVCGKRFIQPVALQTHKRTHLKRSKGKDPADVQPKAASTVTVVEPEQRTSEISGLKVVKPEAGSLAIN